MFITRRNLLLCSVIAVATWLGACGVQEAELEGNAAGEAAADARDQRRDRLVRAAQTHVLVIDGERVPREERVATVRRLELDRVATIILHGAGDPRGRELIGDETDVAGAIELVTAGDERETSSTATDAQSAPTVRDDTSFPALRVPDRLRDAPWILASEDPEGDGQRPGAGDGRALWYWLDAEGDTLWVRMGVHGEIDEEVPAVSLSFDLDEDQETGTAWYGSNTAFRFDEMVSVGPVRREGEGFVGYNGITDADGVRRRDWINVRQGNVAFRLDPEGRSYVVGVALSDLGARPGTLRFIGTVGSQATWNDDLVDDGFVTVDLPPPE